MTITRLWALAVQCNRSMASVAMLTAESKPKEKSVPQMSLSMVLGTATMFSPMAERRAAVWVVPLPPMQTMQSSPNSFMLRSMRRGLLTPDTTPFFLNGFSREVPSMVPPRLSKPESESRVITSVS